MAETQDILFGLKSCRQYTTDFYLAYHKTQYQRICAIADRIKPRRSWNEVNLRNMWHLRVKYADDCAICNLIGIPAFQNEMSSSPKILATVARCSSELRSGAAGDETR